ncbi:hypothetical protein DN730_12065 [Marinomonas piezotolerans]|uniref:Uncharacterized protein n=1 Tax=Marinomonas piezotolerans TaxID=2213058 RepID=A0A370U812_9GAMM|nr:hypothetical protein [Marinomonas piezotolerans]RDL43911.1 hypothetical protein DN730_12065 [Marinomonas piezotolerans]
MKKEPNTDLDLVEEAKKTLAGAKNWFLEDVELMRAYWHDQMGYVEAWVDANWHLVKDESEELLEDLDKREDAALLWLLNHANNNPVPLERCSVAGQEAQAGRYICMDCGHENTHEQGILATCDVCHYGVLYFQGEL